MKYLFFDTETTGFPNGKLNLNHDDQPHLVQVGMLLRDDRKEVARASLVVTCPVEVPEKARSVHGYDQEATIRVGVKPSTACALFCDMAHRADTIVAHNAQFDRKIMDIALLRHGWPKPETSWFCTMSAAEHRCKIPASEKQIRAGFKKRGQFKSPKLEEALKILLREEALEGAHDAMTDVLGCMRLFDWLQENMGTSS